MFILWHELFIYRAYESSAARIEGWTFRGTTLALCYPAARARYGQLTNTRKCVAREKK